MSRAPSAVCRYAVLVLSVGRGRGIVVKDRWHRGFVGEVVGILGKCWGY